MIMQRAVIVTVQKLVQINIEPPVAWDHPPATTIISADDEVRRTTVGKAPQEFVQPLSHP
jgi:hypothetical protein